MMWRVRTTLTDRPGILAAVAAACGARGVNIVSMQVFVTRPDVIDEFVVEAAEAFTDIELAEVFTASGGGDVSVTRVGQRAAADATTRYLQGVREVIEEGREVETVLNELLEVAAPDVADYAGHDVLDLTRRNGSTLRISRAVAFTPVERARAQALLSLVGDAGADVPLIAPSSHQPLPLVRTATLADIDAVAALHQRCSVETLYARFRVPLRMPMTTRLVRRLVAPERGLSLVVQVGLDLVGHGVLEQVADRWTFEMLIEDSWHGHGLATILIRQAAASARSLGAERLTFVTAGGDDQVLRAVGAAGFVARIERHDAAVHVTVPLGRLRGESTG